MLNRCNEISISRRNQHFLPLFVVISYLTHDDAIAEYIKVVAQGRELRDQVKDNFRHVWIYEEVFWSHADGARGGQGGVVEGDQVDDVEVFRGEDVEEGGRAPAELEAADFKVE